MPHNTQVLGLIIKSTRKCNLRCSYCHDWRAKSEFMPFRVLATLIAKALCLPEHRRIDFIWHGGEPLLLGKEYYKKALGLQQEFTQPKQNIRNSLQTNGTLLNDEWCEFFKENGFSIGLSIDGPEVIHNVNRPYASGKGSFQEVRRAIGLLEKHTIPFGVLMVLNHNAMKHGPEELFQFFIDLGVQTFAFLPVRPDNIAQGNGHSGGDYINPEEYSAFMSEVFDIWYKRDDPSVRVRELTSLLGAIIGGSSSVCTLAGNCLGQYFHVEPNGDLYHCDKFLGDKNYQVGNILLQGFRDIRGSEKFRSLVIEEEQRISKLRSCPWFQFCNGGCPHDRYIASKYLPAYDGTCCGQDKLIEHIYQNVSADILRHKPPVADNESLLPYYPT